LNGKLKEEVNLCLEDRLDLKSTQLSKIWRRAGYAGMKVGVVSTG